jgi:hypothetical protein
MLAHGSTSFSSASSSYSGKESRGIFATAFDRINSEDAPFLGPSAKALDTLRQLNEIAFGGPGRPKSC